MLKVSGADWTAPETSGSKDYGRKFPSPRGSTGEIRYERSNKTNRSLEPALADRFRMFCDRILRVCRRSIKLLSGHRETAISRISTGSRFALVDTAQRSETSFGFACW